MKTIAVEDSLGLTVCNKQQIAIERGLGSYVWDEDGRKYLDFTSGWGVTALGHSHPVIVDAITNQASKLMQNPNSGFTYSPVRSRLLAKMQSILPAGLHRIFFANSGAEANDGAVKLARKVTGRPTVIAVSGSFHGRTLSTLSLSGGPENAARYLPVVPSNVFAPFGDIEALAALMSAQVAAVIVEPVQGEGGVQMSPPGYLKALSSLCREHGALFIADEVQTGFCRTGSFFAVDAAGVNPDILTMGKGIAGGFPFAAFAVSDAVAAGIQKGDHGGTYCGNPLGCAVAEAVLDYLQANKIAARTLDMGATILQRLAALPTEFPEQVSALRGRGLLIGIQMRSDAQVTALAAACLEQGLIVVPTRNGVLRLIPSLLVSVQEVDEAIGLLRSALLMLQSENADEERCAVN